MGAIDLHIHTGHSADGEIPPSRLLDLAAAAGLKALSITDHNKTSAVNEAQAAGAARGVGVVPGIEIDCHLHEFEVHLLGHFIDHNDKRYRDLWDDIEGQEKSLARRRIDLVRRLGLAVDEDEVLAKSKGGVVTGELLAEIALARPENRSSPVLAPYYPGGARSDNPYVNFYWDYCSQGKPAHVKIAVMPLRDAIALVMDTGGLPSLAHPGNTLKHHKDMFPDLVAAGIMGVEAFSSYHTPDENQYWLRQGTEHDMLITCGSDFHGKTKPAIKLGGHGGDAGEAAYFETMLARAAKRSSPAAARFALPPARIGR